MTTAKLIPCLVLLRATFDDLFPGRPLESDGWIGDEAHRQRKSKHNPDSRGLVHAIDVTKFEGIHQVVLHLAERCRTGAEKRLTAIIWHGTIWLPENNWEPVDYYGEDRHYEHAHFSGSDTPALEKNQASWHLEETPMDLTPEAIDKIAAAVTAKMRNDPKGAVSQVDDQQIARAVVGSDGFRSLSDRVDQLAKSYADLAAVPKPATPDKTPAHR